jgi:hypothetical protein
VVELSRHVRKQAVYRHDTSLSRRLLVSAGCTIPAVEALLEPEGWGLIHVPPNGCCQASAGPCFCHRLRLRWWDLRRKGGAAIWAFCTTALPLCMYLLSLLLHTPVIPAGQLGRHRAARRGPVQRHPGMLL